MGLFDDLPEAQGGVGLFDDLPDAPSPAGGLGQPALPVRVERIPVPSLGPMPAESAWAKLNRTMRAGVSGVRESLSPLIGPTEEQRLRDAVGFDENGQPIYKPAGSKVDQEGFFPALSHPMIPIPAVRAEDIQVPPGAWAPSSMITPEDQARAKGMAAAALNTGKGFVEFAESPLGLATGGAGKLVQAGAAPAGLGRVIAGGYAADMAAKVPEAARAAGELSVTGTPQQRYEANLGLGTQIGLAGLLGAHTAAPAGAPTAQEIRNPRAEGRTEQTLTTENTKSTEGQQGQQGQKPATITDAFMQALQPAEAKPAEVSPAPSAPAAPVYTVEQAIKDLPGVISDLKATLEQNRLGGSEQRPVESNQTTTQNNGIDRARIGSGLPEQPAGVEAAGIAGQGVSEGRAGTAREGEHTQERGQPAAAEAGAELTADIERARSLLAEHGTVGIAMLQRLERLPYARASAAMDAMARTGEIRKTPEGRWTAGELTTEAHRGTEDKRNLTTDGTDITDKGSFDKGPMPAQGGGGVAPETGTVRTATGAESSAPRSTEEQTGSAMTAEAVQPARGALPSPQDAIRHQIVRNANERDMADAMREKQGVDQSLSAESPDVQAHGTATLSGLESVLNGFDEKRTLYTGALSKERSNTGSDARLHSPFVVVGHPGRMIKSRADIAGVLVSDLYAPDVHLLEQLFPGVKFAPASKAESIVGLGAAAVTHGKTIVPKGARERTPEEQAAWLQQRMANRERRQAGQERPWDLIDELENNLGGKISLTKARALIEDFKPIGAARKLFAANGHAPDIAAQSISHVKQLSDVDLLEAVNAAARARQTGRARNSQERQVLATEAKQATAFQRDSAKPGTGKETVVAEDLNVGDVFTLKGAKLRVKELNFDEAGQVTSVELEDGKKYGTQVVEGKTVLQVDQGTMETRNPRAEGRKKAEEPKAETLPAPLGDAEQAAEQAALAKELGYDEEPAAAPSAEAPAASPAPAKPSESAQRAGKLRAIADNLTELIDAKRNPAVSRQNLTARRANIADGMAREADRYEWQQKTLRELAQAHDNGTVPESLKNVTARTHLEYLQRMHHPTPGVHKVWLDDLFKRTEGKRGSKAPKDVLSGVRYRSDAHIQLYGEREWNALKELADLADKAGAGWAVKSIKEAIRDHNALAKLGWETREAWEQAKRDVQALSGPRSSETPQAVKVRQLERQLIGTKIPGFFPTPKPVIDEMLSRADIQPGMQVLEPSAGKGDIADAIKAKGVTPEVVEQSQTLQEILRAKGYEPTGTDFLQHRGQYDRIVMNPPFEQGQDMAHVRHAYDLLKPGGKVVAIMSEGPFFRNDAKAVEFRRWLEEVGGTSEKMEEGSFTGKEAFRQTGVNTRLVEISREKAQETQKPGFALDRPESVEEQKARLAQEEQQQQSKAQQEKLAELAGKPLAGSRGDIGQGDLLGGGDLFSRRDEAGPSLDPQSRQVLSSLYGTDPQTPLLQEPYQLGELPLPAAERAAAAAGQPKPGGTAVSGRLRALSREALTTLTPQALGKALARQRKVSSLDPKATPHEIPQYRVNGTVIHTPEDFAATLVSLRSPYSESLKVVLLDARDVVRHSQVLYSGTLDTTALDGRDFLRLFERYGKEAKRMMISHNHPSGDPTPSSADWDFTARLKEMAKTAGFELVDHVITNGKRFYSLSRGGLMELSQEHVAAWEVVPRDQLQPVGDADRYQAIVASLRQTNPNVAHIIYANTQFNVTAIERAAPTAQAVQRALVKGIGTEGARSVLIDFGPTVKADDAYAWARKLNDVLKDRSTQTEIVDFSADGVLSGYSAGYHLDEAVKASAPAGEVLREGAREYLPSEEEAGTRTLPERDWKEIQREVEAKAEELKSALTRREGKASRQEQAEIAARYRELREELMGNREFVGEMLTKHDQLIKDLAHAKDAKDAEGTAKLQAELENARAMLEQAPAGVLNAVTRELQDKGVLEKSRPPLNVGRGLDQVTDWLRQADAISPKRGLRERLVLGQQVVSKVNQFKDFVGKAQARLAMAWKTWLQSYKSPPVDTPFRSVLKDWKFADEWTGQQTRQFVGEINQAVENPLRQQALSVWLEAAGDEGLIRFQAAQVPERFRAAWDTALKLTPKEKELALKIKADFESKLEDALNAGLLERGREHYGVPQMWDKAPEVDPSPEGKRGVAGQFNAKLDPRDPFFALSRQVPTYFDGIMRGGVPRSLKIADLTAAYNLAFHKSLSSRAAIWALKNEKASDGEPLVKISGSATEVGHSSENRAYVVDSKARNASDVTKDGRPYRSLDHFALRDWRVGYKTSDGKVILVRGDMLVHPDAYQYLKNELGQSPLRDPEGAGKWLNPVFRSNAYLKASKLALGTFHMATIGEHMLSHLQSPFTRGFKIDLREKEQALLVRNGLELGMSGPMELFEEGLTSHGGIWAQVPGLGDVMRKFTDWMFRDYIPTVSMKVGLEVLKHNRARYGKELTENQIAELTAAQMNAASGLMNNRMKLGRWEALGRNKTLMDLGRMTMLAPMFLEARARVVGQALKPYGHEQRKLLLVQALTLYGMARALNLMIDDDPHWEAKNAFSVVIKGRAYGIRTIVGDTWHAVTDPQSFAAGRLSPLFRTLIETITQRDMRTGARKEPPIQTHSTVSRLAQNLVVDMVKWLAPIGSEGILPGAAGREQGPLDTALGSLGVGSRKWTAGQQVSEWANEFNRKQPDAKTQRFQTMREAAVKGQSPYRKLDALLDAGEVKQARKEFEALLEEGHTREGIAQHYRQIFRPFTGALARENAFKESLSERQRKAYEKAIEERRQRMQRFNELLAKMAATN